MGGSSRRRDSGAGGRGRRARRAAAEPEPEYAPQMEEVDVKFNTGSYPVTQGEPSWEAAIEHTGVGHETSGQVRASSSTVKHAHYIELWNASETSRPRCDPLTTYDFDLSSSVCHYWLLQNSRSILITQAEREAWLLIFPSSGLRRGSSGSGHRHRPWEDRVGGAAVEQVAEVDGPDELRQNLNLNMHRMEEVDVKFDTRSYPVTQGEPSWEAAIEHTGVGHETSGQVWRGTPRRMNVESEEDSDDEDSGHVRGGVADDDDDGERGAEARVRNPPRRYDDTGSLHRQTLTRRRCDPRN
ncbi:hypothetical protein GQ457_17G010990 [Hibiscus cannabinus]